jgi:predicted aldo/keto reductase-like oxidoreductase
MKYRNYKVADTELSLLGFGVMRLPVLEDGDTVDEDEAIRMIRYAADQGVNYFDTAYVYHGGQSERVLGKALAGGLREKVLVATKLPYWIMKDPSEMLPAFEKSLERLGTDYVDNYLVHDINDGRWDLVREWKIFDFLAKLKEEGRIRFAGFSYHGESPALFREVLDAYPWDFVQIQLNYMDTQIQAGLEGYEYAAKKGVPVVVMEPLKGGKLTDAMPPSVQAYWDSLGKGRTPAEWALRWVANLPGVTTILSGMSTFSQVEENVRVLSDAEAGGLTAEELDTIAYAAEEYRKLIVYPCTACKYCMPCTAGIDIPSVMNFRNWSDVYGVTDKQRAEFNMFLKPGKPSACVKCGKCEEECPQGLAIMKAMDETAAIYE